MWINSNKMDIIIDKMRKQVTKQEFDGDVNVNERITVYGSNKNKIEITNATTNKTKKTLIWQR